MQATASEGFGFRRIWVPAEEPRRLAYAIRLVRYCDKRTRDGFRSHGSKPDHMHRCSPRRSPVNTDAVSLEELYNAQPSRRSAQLRFRKRSGLQVCWSLSLYQSSIGNRAGSFIRYDSGVCSNFEGWEDRMPDLSSARADHCRARSLTA